MNDWPCRPLLEICERITDGSHRTPQFVETGYPFVTVAHVDSEGKIDFSGCNKVSLADYQDLKKNDCRPLPGDVLFSKDGTVGKVALIDFDADFVILSSLAIIRPNRSLLSPKFLAYALRSNSVLSQAVNKKSGSAIRRIVLRDLCKVTLPLPPLAVQERLARLLDEADELRKLRARADRHTAELIPALFNKMFGGRESVGFIDAKLGEVAKIKSGAGFPLDKQGRLDQPIPFFKVGDMNTQGNEWAMRICQHTISEATRKELGATLLPADSIVFPKVGAAIGTNKKRVIICPSCVDNNVMAVIPGENITPEFLLAMVNTKNLMDFASSSTPPSIRKTAVEGWEIRLPPLPLQIEFAVRVQEIRKLEADQADSRFRLEALFQSLLHHAFNGAL